MHSGQCPKCEKRLDYFKTEEVELRMGTRKRPGLSHSCPKCKTVVAVELDPYHIANRIVSELGPDS